MDESVNNIDLSKRCNAAGKVIVHRYPKELRGKKDYEMLPILLVGHDTLLTTDRRIVEQHSEYIPHDNSGMIVVKTIHTDKPLTIKTINVIIETYKQKVVRWETLDFANTYVELDERGAYVSRLDGHSFANGAFLPIGTVDFQEKFAALVSKVKGGSAASAHATVISANTPPTPG